MFEKIDSCDSFHLDKVIHNGSMVVSMACAISSRLFWCSNLNSLPFSNMGSDEVIS